MRPLVKSANERLQHNLFIAALYTTCLPCWDGKQLDESNTHRSIAAKRNTDVVRSILKRHWVQLDHAHHQAFAQHTLQDFGWYSRPVMQASARARCIRQATSQAICSTERPVQFSSPSEAVTQKVRSPSGCFEDQLLQVLHRTRGLEATTEYRSPGLIEQHFRSCQLQCRMMLSNGLTFI